MHNYVFCTAFPSLQSQNHRLMAFELFLCILSLSIFPPASQRISIFQYMHMLFLSLHYLTLSRSLSHRPPILMLAKMQISWDEKNCSLVLGFHCVACHASKAIHSIYLFIIIKVMNNMKEKERKVDDETGERMKREAFNQYAVLRHTQQQITLANETNLFIFFFILLMLYGAMNRSVGKYWQHLWNE